MKDLAACPFCGGPARAREEDGESLWSHAVVRWLTIGCPDCDIEMRSEEHDELVERWNTRRRAKR